MTYQVAEIGQDRLRPIRIRTCPSLAITSTWTSPLRRIPPFNGRLRLEYGVGETIEAAAEWVFAAGHTRLSSGDLADHRIPPGGTPSWQIVNVRGLWRRGRLSVGVGLQNLFDEAYRTHGSGIDGAGRCVWVGLGWAY